MADTSYLRELECYPSEKPPHFNINIHNNLSQIDLETGIKPEIHLFESLTLENCVLEECTYKELQHLAKKHFIKANLSKDSLITALQGIKNNEEISLDYRSKSWIKKNPAKILGSLGGFLLIIAIIMIILFLRESPKVP